MTESPSYNIEKKDGNFEIREYADYILAQVDVETDYINAMSMGFSILANYIFGGNKKKSKIPMTTPVAGVNVSVSEKIPMAVPVTEEKTGKEIYRISFTMPSKYNLETLPEPDDHRIKFKEEKNQRMAVIRFSGRVKEDLSIKKIDELKTWLDKTGIEPRSNFIVAQYNHPAVPGFLRKNEIIVKI